MVFLTRKSVVQMSIICSVPLSSSSLLPGPLLAVDGGSGCNEVEPDEILRPDFSFSLRSL